MENEPCFQIPKAWHYEKTDRARQGNRRERKKLCKYILNITTNNLVAILNAIKKALTTALVREWGVASETWRTGEKITCHDKSINHKRCGACEKEKSARSHTPTNWFLAVSSVSSTNNRTPKQAIHVCNHNNNNANSNELWRLSANYTQQCHPNIRYAERENKRAFCAQHELCILCMTMNCMTFFPSSLSVSERKLSSLMPHTKKRLNAKGRGKRMSKIANEMRFQQ